MTNEEAIKVLKTLDFPCDKCPMDEACRKAESGLCDEAFKIAIAALHEKQECEHYGDEPEGRLDAICGQFQIGYSDSLFLRELLRAYEDEGERDNPKPLTFDELREMNGKPVWIVLPKETEDNQFWIIRHEWTDTNMCGKPALMLHTKWYLLEDYGKTWLAYRTKPKEAQS